MKRRNFLKSSLLTVGAVGLSKYAIADKPIPQRGDPADHHLTTYHHDSVDSSVWIRWKNSMLTCYRAEALQKYPYFYPLRAMKSGLSLTAENAQPWPHHRSVFFGLDNVNGCNFWHYYNPINNDRIISKKLELGECTENSAEIFNECLWTPLEKEPIIADKRRLVLTVLDENTYTLDCYFELTALTEVVCQRTNHGLFGVRLEPDLSVDGGGVILSSEGAQKEANLHNKYARWITAYGQRYYRNDGLIEGLAIMSPPYKRTPFDKSIWFVRDYGNFSPMPFDLLTRDENFVMPKDDVLRLAYRIVAFTGTPTTSFLNAHWDEFAALSEGKRS